jgi:protein phosphatase
MENDEATIYCQNELCQAPNPLNHNFCQRCSTPLLKRYLWVERPGLRDANPGTILANRYLVINQSLVLDTKPRLLPQVPEVEDLQTFKAYLRLIPYRIHIPQVYGILSLGDGNSQKDILLLEKPPVFADATGQQVQLHSELTNAWGHGTSIRQINWLWQIAHLWQPLLSEGVASSLLDPYLLRVEGSLVRLLELQADASPIPDLTQLGKFWQQYLLPTTRPAVAEFINQITTYLIEEEIRSSEQLIAALDQGLAELGRSQTPTIKIYTKTDTGRTRQRNEDACYPPSDNLVSKPPQNTALAIVCDGIGGHEGGNVASNLAIDTIQQQVKQLTQVPPDRIDPLLLIDDIEKAVANANDKISQRNDSENRQGRQRMGTTLVMGLPIAHEMYISHVGDSRAYWITRQGCYQVTLDDDVASREVRLGYAVYREATQQGGAGSLIQALGMSPSHSLHPTTQRFILDEDTVFLLTSDGLSDYDRVEEYWETEILPILNEETDVANVAARLIDIANTRNGHDNVTVALIHYQVKYVEPNSSIRAVIPEPISTQFADTSPGRVPDTILGASQKTQVIPENKPTGFRLSLGLIIPFLVVTAAGLLGYWFQVQRSPAKNQPAATPTATTQPTPTPVAKTPKDPSTTAPANTPEFGPPLPRSLDNLAPGFVIKTTQPVPVQKNPDLIPNTLFKVIEKTSPANQPEQWLVEECSSGKQRIIFEKRQLTKYNFTVLPDGKPSQCNVPSPQDNEQSTSKAQGAGDAPIDEHS